MCPQIKAPIHSANSAKWMAFSMHISSMSCPFRRSTMPLLTAPTLQRLSQRLAATQEIEGGAREERRREKKLGKRDILIIVKLKIHNLEKYWGYICHGYISCPQFSPMNLQFLFFKHLFVNILQVTESYFLLFSSFSLFFSLSSLLCCLLLSEPDTSPW